MPGTQTDDEQFHLTTFHVIDFKTRQGHAATSWSRSRSPLSSAGSADPGAEDGWLLSRRRAENLHPPPKD